jgi:hypothetical protein
MKINKPLSEHQKRSLGNAIEVLNNPISAMDVYK